MDHKEIRAEITKNWMMALEYLIDSGRVKNYRQFEEMTGIRNQRISVIKKTILDGEDSTNYVSVDYVKILNEQFQVSLEFIFYGTKPIVNPDIQGGDSKAPAKGSQMILEKMNSLENQVENLMQKVKLLERGLDLTERELKIIHAK